MSPLKKEHQDVINEIDVLLGKLWSEGVISSYTSNEIMSKLRHT